LKTAIGLVCCFLIGVNAQLAAAEVESTLLSSTKDLLRDTDSKPPDKRNQPNLHCAHQKAQWETSAPSLPGTRLPSQEKDRMAA